MFAGITTGPAQVPAGSGACTSSWQWLVQLACLSPCSPASASAARRVPGRRPQSRPSSLLAALVLQQPTPPPTTPPLPVTLTSTPLATKCTTALTPLVASPALHTCEQRLRLRALTLQEVSQVAAKLVKPGMALFGSFILSCWSGGTVFQQLLAVLTGGSGCFN